MLTHLQLQHHLHLVTTQWTDVVQDQSCDDVDTIGLVGHDTRLDHTHIYTQLLTSQAASMTKDVFTPLVSLSSAYLVLLTGALTVFCECLQGLDDEVDV